MHIFVWWLNLSNYLEEYASFFSNKILFFFPKSLWRNNIWKFSYSSDDVSSVLMYQVSSKQTCLIRMRKKKKKKLNIPPSCGSKNTKNPKNPWSLTHLSHPHFFQKKFINVTSVWYKRSWQILYFSNLGLPIREQSSRGVVLTSLECRWLCPAYFHTFRRYFGPCFSLLPHVFLTCLTVESC